MMRAVQGSTVLYPSDATSAAALVAAMADRPGIKYMRTTRGAYPVLYPAGEQFPVGGSKVLRETAQDQVTLVGAGVTLHNCLAAAAALGDQGLSARVVALYCVQPAHAAPLTAAARQTGRLVLVEDHHRERGLGQPALQTPPARAPPPTPMP